MTNLKTHLPRLAIWLALALLVTTASAQVGGNRRWTPPTDLHVEITTSDAGLPVLSEDEFELVAGDYYRFNFACSDVIDDRRGWRIEITELLQNSHLRMVSVGDIEIHLQGLTFRGIECDEVGTAKVSLVPIRPGVYDLYVGNVPTAVGRPVGAAGVRSEGKFVIGKIVVE